MKKLPMFDVRQCRGSICHNPAECLFNEACSYRSSADQAREVMVGSMFLQQADSVGEEKAPSPEKVADFNGTVDGKGIKGVMFSPKTGIQMISPYFVEGVGDVLTYGAKKYAKNNWMRGMAYSEVFGGIMRHLWAWFRGEDLDPVEKGGSGLPHLYHAACGLMFLVHYTSDPKYSQFDDRVFK